jgi:hypothetical protein
MGSTGMSFFSFCFVDEAQMPRNLMDFVQLLCRVENIPLLGLKGLVDLTCESVGFPVLMLTVDKAAPEPFNRLSEQVMEIWNATMSPGEKTVLVPGPTLADTKLVKVSEKAAVPVAASGNSASCWHLAKRADGRPAFTISAN